MTRFYQIFICISLGLGVVSLTSAATYNKWTDADGNVHYSQQPPSGVNYEKITVKTSPSKAGSKPSTSNSPSYSGSDSTKGDAVVKHETAKAEARRQQNCTAAKKNLELYTVYRRVRDKDGKVVVLGDDERAKRIADSKAAVKEFCQ